MKKQITITALGLISLVGGSWLAAQQRDSVRTTRSSSSAAPADDHVVEDDGDKAARPEEEASRNRRPSVASAVSPQRSGRPRPAAQDVRAAAQDARAAADAYREDAARYPIADQAYAEIAGTGGQRIWMPDVRQRMAPEDAARMRAFQDAIKELREAENAEEKAAAREQVTKLVSEQLEADLENREKELTAIEQRAKELRKQLEERKTAKPELLKMLVMLIDNPQVGLGIPPEWMQMLMRGQPGRNHQGFPINVPGDQTFVYPIAPPQPASPPSPIDPLDSAPSADLSPPADLSPNR